MTAYEGWAVVELMGHRLLAGRVAEVEAYGGKLLQLNIYDEASAEPGVTQFYGAPALYCVTPTTEAVARSIGARKLAHEEVMPVARWELAQAAPDPRDDPRHYELEPPL